MNATTYRLAPAALWCACIALCLAAAPTPFDDEDVVEEIDDVENVAPDYPADAGGADGADLPGLEDAPPLAEQEPAIESSLLAAYRASGFRTPQCDDEVTALLHDWELATRPSPESPQWTELSQRAKALIESECNTWPVHYVRVVALRGTEYPGESRTAVQDAMDALQREAAPPFFLAFVARAGAEVFEQWRQPDEARQFHELAAHYALQILHSGCVGVTLQSLTSNLRATVDQLPLDLAESFSKRSQEHECVPHWLRETLLGEFHMRAAWEARGTGWAHTVTPEGWRGFAHHLSIASEHLREAYRLDPMQPYAAARMIAVVMAGHGTEDETLRLWHDRALAARPDWRSAHSQMLWALRPRWGGSLEEMHEFGMRFVEADSDLAEIYLDMIRSIGSDKQGDFTFLAERKSHATTAAVIERLMTRPRSPEVVQWYRSIEAVLAWAEGKWEMAARALDQAGGTLHTKFCDQVWLWPDDVADEIRLFSSSVGPTAFEAREALAVGSFDRASELNHKALAALDVEEPHAERIAHLLREQRTLAEQAKQYMAGEWVNLVFGPDLEGWRVRLGHWHSSSSATVKGGRPRRSGHGTRAVSLLPVGPRFEAKADIQLHSHLANGGFIFHIGNNPNGRWIAAVTSREGVRLRYYYDEENAIARRGRISRGGSTLHLIVWEDRAIVRLNDQVVFDGAVPTGEHPERLGSHFGLGCLWVAGGSVSMYESVQVRRLKKEPEGLLRTARD